MLDMAIISTRIQNARAEQGFTQNELALRLGISGQAVSKWERGQSLPDIELVADLCRILGITSDYLLDMTGTKAPSAKRTAYDLKNSNILENPSTDYIVIKFGVGLIQYFTDNDNAAIRRITAFRRAAYNESGVLLPAIRIMDDGSLNENELIVAINGHVALDKAYSPEQDTEAIFPDISGTVMRLLPLFCNRHMVKLLVERLAEQLPFCVDGVVPERVSLSKLRYILLELVRAGLSIKNLLYIIETADECVEKSSSIEDTITQIKRGLAQYAK